MNNKKQISETRSTEVIAYILNQYDKENINRNLDVCAELVLISRIIMQRFRKNFGLDFKKNIIKISYYSFLLRISSPVYGSNRSFG